MKSRGCDGSRFDDRRRNCRRLANDIEDRGCIRHRRGCDDDCDCR